MKTFHPNYVVSFEICSKNIKSFFICNAAENDVDKNKKELTLWITSNQDLFNSIVECHIICFKENFLSLNDWQLIKISHFYVDPLHYNYTISVNEKIVYSTTDNISRTFKDVEVAFNRWNKSVDSSIKNVNITSKGKG